MTFEKNINKELKINLLIDAQIFETVQCYCRSNKELCIHIHILVLDLSKNYVTIDYQIIKNGE